MRKRTALISVFFVFAAVLILVRNSTAAEQFLSHQHAVFLPVVFEPAPVVIAEWDMRGLDRDGWGGVGDVLSPEDVVTNVIVEGKQFALDGTLLYTITVTTAFTTTLPGQRNPFSFGFPLVGENCCEYSFDIISWSAPTTANIYPLTVISTTIQYSTFPDPASAFVVASVRNDSPVPLTNVKGVIWCVHQKHFITSQLISDLLMPGETATFTQFLDGIAVWMQDSIRISVQGRDAP